MSLPEETTFDEREKELLRFAVQPQPIDAARAHETARKAVAARSRAAAPSRLWRNLAFAVSAAAIVVCFAVMMLKGSGGPAQPAGASTIPTGAPMTLAQALEVANDKDNYQRRRAQAAMHTFYLDVHRLLRAIENQETVARPAREAVLDALQGPIVAVPYHGGFEELFTKVDQQQPLTEAELRAVTDAARTCIGALRQLAVTHVLHAAEVKLLCTYLGKRARGESDPASEGTTPRRQQ